MSKGCNCGGRTTRRVRSESVVEERFAMDGSLVPMNLKTGVALPVKVVLPLKFHAQFGIDRRLVITSRTQKVPAAVLEWLQNDKHTSGLFDASEGIVQGKAARVPPESARKSPQKAARAENSIHFALS